MDSRGDTARPVKATSVLTLLSLYLTVVWGCAVPGSYRVLDAVSGEPVIAARVTLLLDPIHPNGVPPSLFRVESARTDSDGRVTLPRWAEGHKVEVVCTQYQMTIWDLYPRQASAPLASGTILLQPE